MSNRSKKITELPLLTTPSLSGVTVIVQDDVTYEVTIESLKTILTGDTETGSSGTSGSSGSSGTSGTSGVAGPEGPAGEDGNANVTIINLLSENIIWEDSNYLGRSATISYITNASINEDILDHGTVLGYCKISEMPDVWSPLPFMLESDDGSYRMYILYDYRLSTITLIAYQTTGFFDPTDYVMEYRFMLITDNTII